MHLTQLHTDLIEFYEMKKFIAQTIMVILLTGLLPVAWSVIAWAFEVDNKVKSIDDLKKKVDNIHWYLIERNQVKLPRRKK